MGYGGIDWDSVDMDAVNEKYNELQEERQQKEELANKPWYESLWDETKNTAEWAYDLSLIHI